MSVAGATIHSTETAFLLADDEPVDDHIATLTQHLSQNELATLSDLLDKLRTDQKG